VQNGIKQTTDNGSSFLNSMNTKSVALKQGSKVMQEKKDEKLSSMRMKKKRESSENLHRELKNALHAQ